MINIDEKEDRKNYIGGIDAPVIVLPNPKWKTKYQLWLEKTGRVEPKDISDKPEVEFGILQEEVVRKKFSFNPCFNGSMYKNISQKISQKRIGIVSILVLMDLCIKTEVFDDLYHLGGRFQSLF